VSAATDLDQRPRLDVWLARERGITRHAAQALIAAGAVRVNRRPGSSARRIGPGDSVDVDPQPAQVGAAPVSPGPPVELDVVYEDEWLAVVDKPAGLVVHPAPGHPHGTLADGLRQRGATWSLWGGEERPGIVHRLDRDTSGLLVVAKSEAAHRHLAAQLQSRSLTRVYWALAHGRFTEATATIDAPIGRDPRDRRRMAVTGSGRSAVTELAVLAGHLRSSELEVRLRTGRTHQIRVHLAFIGHPLVGDPIYGRRHDDAPRLALHARLLRLAHPADGHEMTFESALPVALVELREAARQGRR
jgi:23S rRNA pseudouridine1911/1915/1917 synthase